MRPGAVEEVWVLKFWKKVSGGAVVAAWGVLVSYKTSITCDNGGHKDHNRALERSVCLLWMLMN